MSVPEIITGLLSAAVSSLGFAIVFRVRKKHLFATALGGALCYAIYLLVAQYVSGEFFSNFLGSLLAAIFCMICSRSLRAPVQIYLIPVLIPLFPGGSLYYAMYHLLAKDYALFSEFIVKTLEAALGIAGGMIVGLALANSTIALVRKIRAKRANNDDRKQSNR